jgi:hypothetical protein
MILISAQVEVYKIIHKQHNFIQELMVWRYSGNGADRSNAGFQISTGNARTEKGKFCRYLTS